jgi:phosphatidate phosphatase LPIN
LGASDWSQDGIASLYTNISKNGYKILYLTSRPIGYSETTKKYLNNIK